MTLITPIENITVKTITPAQFVEFVKNIKPSGKYRVGERVKIK